VDVRTLAAGLIVAALFWPRAVEEEETVARYTEEQHISMMAAELRPVVRRMMKALRAKGYQPRIVFSWRSLQKQRELYQRGRSQLLKGEHNHEDANGDPAARAVDIIDRRWGWTVTAENAEFFRELRDLTRSEGGESGSDWSLARSAWKEYGLGWDPAHQQWPKKRLAA